MFEAHGSNFEWWCVIIKPEKKIVHMIFTRKLVTLGDIFLLLFFFFQCFFVLRLGKRIKWCFKVVNSSWYDHFVHTTQFGGNIQKKNTRNFVTCHNESDRLWVCVEHSVHHSFVLVDAVVWTIFFGRFSFFRQLLLLSRNHQIKLVVIQFLLNDDIMKMRQTSG